MVFDNTTIKRFVPGYCAPVPFTLGIRRTIAWFDPDPSQRQVDTEVDTRWDKVIEAYDSGTQQALRDFVENGGRPSSQLEAAGSVLRFVEEQERPPGGREDDNGPSSPGSCLVT